LVLLKDKSILRTIAKRYFGKMKAGSALIDQVEWSQVLDHQD
jgi:hypothetical protein